MAHVRAKSSGIAAVPTRYGWLAMAFCVRPIEACPCTLTEAPKRRPGSAGVDQVSTRVLPCHLLSYHLLSSSYLLTCTC